MHQANIVFIYLTFEITNKSFFFAYYIKIIQLLFKHRKNVFI